MKTGFRRLGIMSILGLGCVLTAPGQAQSVRDVRIHSYPNNRQIGIVTQVRSDAAWVKMPHRVPDNARMEFLFFSDGGDVMYAGKVMWAAPVEPYEAYVTEIKPIATYHAVNPIDDILATGTVTRRKKRLSSVPLADPNGASLAAGMFVRAPIAPIPPDADGVEPVRAHIEALRARPGKFARLIAESAEKSFRSEVEVDYSTLYEALLPFRKTRLEDPITVQLLNRLFTLTIESGTLGKKVPADLLRAPGAWFNMQGGGGLLGGSVLQPR